MTNQEAQTALANLKRYMSGGGAVDRVTNKAIDLAIEALGAQPEPCEDAVSREAVKEQMFKYGFLAPDMTVTEFVEDCLPPVTPKQRAGKWILVTDNNGQHFVCNKCGEWRYHQRQKFCGECGAKMEGDAE